MRDYELEIRCVCRLFNWITKAHRVTTSSPPGDKERMNGGLFFRNVDPGHGHRPAWLPGAGAGNLGAQLQGPPTTVARGLALISGD